MLFDTLQPLDQFRLRQSGTGNMGDLADRSKGIARFSNKSGPWLPVQARVQFTAATNQGVATLTMRVDDHDRLDSNSSPYDFVIDQWLNMGYDESDDSYFDYLEWAAQPEEFWRFVRHPDDEIVFLWTDPGTTKWGIELALYQLPDASLRIFERIR